MGYRVLATTVLVVHFTYLLYVVFGGFVAWRWPRTIWLHLAACVWGVAVIGALGLRLDCPLTWVEDWARAKAGEGVNTKGFVDRYLEGVLYPPKYTVLLQSLAALTVLVSWIGFVFLRRARRRRNTTDARKSEDSSSSAATV
ncbi:MAG TPA: DUF2784 domain-containing protein [Micromonosporaceae bacterium]|nr:DUF2784 domain-containing protein [Micromonosporaceae bacterium]